MNQMEEHLETHAKFMVAENPNTVRLVPAPVDDPIERMGRAISRMNDARYHLCCTGHWPSFDMRLLEQAEQLAAALEVEKDASNKVNFPLLRNT
jgi:hypothetical protein